MNAATRAQAAGLLAVLLDVNRPGHTHHIARANRILTAARRRDHRRLPARAARQAERDALPCLECAGLPSECQAINCPHLERRAPVSQAEYCQGCAHLGGCNVLLADGEVCSDRHDLTPTQERFGFFSK